MFSCSGVQLRVSGLRRCRWQNRRGTHDPARVDGGRDDPAGIDALEAQPVELAAVALEIPPRDAVLRAHHSGVRAKERAQLRRERGQAVGLHAEEDDVGLANRGEIAGHGGLHLEIAVRADDAQAALLHRPQMRAAGEQTTSAPARARRAPI